MRMGANVTRQGHVFGPNLDSVVERAPCEVTLVTLHDETIGAPVALAGPGPPFTGRCTASSRFHDCRWDDADAAERPATDD